MKYKTCKDIVIPAGTELHIAPTKVVRAMPFLSILQAVDKDSTLELTIPIEEAIRTELVIYE